MIPVPSTTPYSWPYDGALMATRCALVVCGSGPTWSARCPLDVEAEANIERLRNTAAQVGVATVLLRHHEPARVVPISGPAPEPLEPRAGEHVVEAVGIDGFYGSGLDALLRRLGRDQLLLVGRGLETTVHSTLRRANDRGYECLTIGDACAAVDSTLRAAAISSIEMSGGIFGAVGSTDAVITTLNHSEDRS